MDIYKQLHIPLTLPVTSASGEQTDVFLLVLLKKKSISETDSHHTPFIKIKNKITKNLCDTLDVIDIWTFIAHVMDTDFYFQLHMFNIMSKFNVMWD